MVVVKQYHNKHLRLLAHNSSTIKHFVCLKSKQYIRLMRVLLYYDGMWVMSPIDHIYWLWRIQVDFQCTTLESNRVPMTRKMERDNDNISCLVKILVTTI